jgi:hypothetical protein
MRDAADRPDWKEMDAVADWAYRKLDDERSEQERQFYMLRWDTHPGIPMSEIHRWMVTDAVAKARDGNFELLADLLRPEHPMNLHLAKSIRETLPPEVWRLIADRLSGRLKVRRGRPRMTEEERRVLNPIHDAADDLPPIESILREAYPNQNAGQIHDRALHGVARHHEVSQDALENYVRRAKTDHRRPTRHPRKKSG